MATIVVHGLNFGAGNITGVFGADVTPIPHVDLSPLGLPTSDVSPRAMNQIAFSSFYGTEYPGYYSHKDMADLDAVTAQYGGGVPRYAMIIAKFAKEVMRRSGAEQVNLYSISFGGLVSRYLIENDVEGLASSGKIARWICTSGALAGNYLVTQGGEPLREEYQQTLGTIPEDLEHLTYGWINDHIHSPRDTSNSPFYGQFPVHLWLATDDDLDGRTLTEMSGMANDGMVLLHDAQLHNLPAVSRYLGLNPTLSAVHANHAWVMHDQGLEWGIRTQLFSRKRVTVTLTSVEVLREFDGGSLGLGEYVFGVQVFSPRAEAELNITAPVTDLRAEDNSLPFHLMTPHVPQNVDQVWFDDMVHPAETALRINSRVEEIDGDFIYGISEVAGEVRQALTNAQITVPVDGSGSYEIMTADWNGTVSVMVTEYPEFEEPKTAAQQWGLYE